MKLVDTNVLLHAVNLDAPQHGLAHDWIAAALGQGGGLAFTWLPLVGFIRLATHPSLLPRPLNAAEAMSAVDAWLGHPNARLLPPGRRHAAILSGLLAEAGARGNLVNDAHIAAVAIEHGATVASFDGDFRRFRKLSFEWLGGAS